MEKARKIRMADTYETEQPSEAPLPRYTIDIEGLEQILGDDNRVKLVLPTVQVPFAGELVSWEVKDFIAANGLGLGVEQAVASAISDALARAFAINALLTRSK